MISTIIYSQDRVYLENGSKIYGNIFTSVSRDSLYIEMEDGYGIFVPRYLVSAVKYNKRKNYSATPLYLESRFTPDFGKYEFKLQKKDTFYVEKGFYKRASIAGFFGSYTYPEFRLSPQFTFGYKYDNLLNIALFVRYNHFKDTKLIPFGFHYEYEFKSTRDTPFIYVDFGSSLAFKSKSGSTAEIPEGGINYGLGIGHILKLKNSDIRFNFGILSQHVNYNFPVDVNLYSVQTARIFNRLTFGVSYSF